MAMSLWVLILERRPSHAERMLYELVRARSRVDRQGFGTRERYRATSRADLGVVSPDSPWLKLSVREAFEQLEQRGLDAPVLVVAKTIDEEIAVASLRQGAGKLAEEATEQATLGLTLLSEIGNRITRVLSLQSALESVVGMIQRRLGYYSVAVLRLDRQGTSLVMKATAGRLSGVINEQIHMDIRNGLMGWAARHGETVLVNDVDADPRYINSYPERIFSQSELSVPIRVGNDVVGILDVQSNHRNAFNQDDVLVMEAAANQIAVAMENARLHVAQRAAHEQLRELTTYLEDAREEERTRIAREIHDELGRAMTALKLDVSWLIRRLPAGRPGLLQKADAISHTIDETVQIIRRISSELRPGILDDLGLAAAIEWQAETFTERSDIPCELDLDSAGDSLNRRVTTVLFRIFQEALTNVARHAAASRICVSLKVTPEQTTLTVQDDGRGISQSDLGDGRSLGLIGMRERARTLGGRVSFRGRSAEGTTVTACIPREGPESHEP